MIRRLVEGLLLVVTIVGAYFAWQSSQEKSRLTARYQRLALAAGDFPINDTSLIYVKALETGEPLHFAWRIHLPAKCQHQVTTRSGDWLALDSDPPDFVARIRFFRNDQGQMQQYHTFGNSASESSARRRLANLTPAQWKQLQVEQFGAPELAVLKPDQSAVLLRLTLPKELAAQAGKSDPDSSSEPAFEISLRPRAPAP